MPILEAWSSKIKLSVSIHFGVFVILSQIQVFLTDKLTLEKLYPAVVWIRIQLLHRIEVQSTFLMLSQTLHWWKCKSMYEMLCLKTAKTMSQLLTDFTSELLPLTK